MKNGNPISQNFPSALKSWILATRPKTWIASISPVCIGFALSYKQAFSPLNLLLTLLFALLIQIGTNFANDYFDFLKGADTEERKGPPRAVQQGWITPNAMRSTFIFTFTLAFLIAIPLMIQTGLWSLPLAFSAIVFGILYTGGPKPLGYLGLGEVLVFIFFGPVAVCGTYFLQTNSLHIVPFIASFAPGLLSSNILIANNLRDEITDRKAGKKTLVVRFGPLFGAIEYTFCILCSALIPLILLFNYNGPYNLMGVAILFFAAKPYIKKAFDFKNPTDLLPISSAFLLLYTFFFCLAYL